MESGALTCADRCDSGPGPGLCSFPGLSWWRCSSRSVLPSGSSFVVTGRDSARVLETVDGPFDLVAAPVAVRVEAGWSSARTAFASTMGALALRFRDGVLWRRSARIFVPSSSKTSTSARRSRSSVHCSSRTRATPGLVRAQAASVCSVVMCQTVSGPWPPAGARPGGWAKCRRTLGSRRSTPAGPCRRTRAASSAPAVPRRCAPPAGSPGRSRPRVRRSAPGLPFGARQPRRLRTGRPWSSNPREPTSG